MSQLDFGSSVVLSVSEFVGLTNQILENALPTVTVLGELSSLRISKNRWVYCDIKDTESTVRCFGSVFALKQPYEDGMLVRIIARPKLHPQFGFSLNIESIEPAGEGSLKRAFELLKAELTKEGLFDPLRKRTLPRYPARIGLVASEQSAAYADFNKILNHRFGGLEIVLADVQVQGQVAPAQIVAAIKQLNELANPVEVIVLTRGGGSLEDLAAFNDPGVVRAIAASRTPTLVGVGHEVDTSLADLAADVRAATPSNAAQILIPDRAEVRGDILIIEEQLKRNLQGQVTANKERLQEAATKLSRFVRLPLLTLHELKSRLEAGQKRLLAAELARFERAESQLRVLDPRAVLKRGYSIVRDEQGQVVRQATKKLLGERLMLEFSTGNVKAVVDHVEEAE